MTDQTLLSAHQLSCLRDDRVLFEQLSFSLQAGDILQIEGYNGSGKTSLLRILCGLTLPLDGEVRWLGENIEEIRGDYHAELNYIGHAPGVKGELTPLENLRMAHALSAKPRTLDFDEALAKVGLRGFEDTPARSLSAGQQRRVALARLLLNETRLWILDEPFTSLDKAGIAYVEQLLKTHGEAGGVAVLTSHHPVQQTSLKRIHLND